MATADGPIVEADLQAWVDGRLTPERAEAVAAYFAAHPELREQWSRYVEQREALRMAFSEQAAEPIPRRLRPACIIAERQRQRRRQLAHLAAAIALLIVGGGAGWIVRDFLPVDAPSASARLATTVFDDAIAAHRTFSVESRHPVEVGANEETHLVQWLSKRLGHPLIVPDLSVVGFRLIGGRLLSADSGPAALFLYEDSKRTRLSCYYLPVETARETEFRYREQNGVGAFYWVDDGLAYTIAANANRDLLLKAAELIYKQSSPDGVKTRPLPPPGTSG